MSLIVLGPQRPEPNLPAVLQASGAAGPYVAITAGWRHEEGELERLEEVLGEPVQGVPLYRWFDEMGREQPGLGRAYAARQRRIRAMKDLYRVRLHAAMDAVHALIDRLPDDPELVGPELDCALVAVRRIDDEMLARQNAIRAAFPEVADPLSVPAVHARHERAAEQIAGAGTLLIPGGHVAVLLNRLRFFEVDRLLLERLDRGGMVACWSAGAMVLTQRVALFYDDPPEGPSEVEVLDSGLGALRDVVLFPHARRRLRLDRTRRIERLARRFGALSCIGLENGAWLVGSDGRWRNNGRPGCAFRLAEDGRRVDLEAE